MRGTVKTTTWAVNCFNSWCAEKKVTIDFKTVGKSQLIDDLKQFYATVKNAKGEEYGLSSLKGLRAALNR